jgi:hypothetical protein
VTHYAPAWKDKDGNRSVVIAEDWIFTDRSDAHKKLVGDFIFMVPWGLTMDGIHEIDLDENLRGEFPHVPGRYGPVEVAVIAGPIFDAAQRSESNDGG